jgi:hypothetical protein
MGEKYEPGLPFRSTGDAGQDRHLKNILEENSLEIQKMKARKLLRNAVRRNDISEGDTLISLILAKYIGTSTEKVDAVMDGVAGFSRSKHHDETSYKLTDRKAALASLFELTREQK